MRCSACDQLNREGARFCDQCGSPLVAAAAPPPPRRAEPERKQITVLFTDVVGSMNLAQILDPEELRAVMGRLYEVTCEVVLRVQGTVASFTGDGVMAIFGAPVAHEDHAQRACLAALDLSRRLPELAQAAAEQGVELRLRMGLNSGEVVVGEIGESLRSEYAAIGQTVGLAKRMESLAPEGEIALNASTAGLVAGEFELDELGSFGVKGVSDRQRVFALRSLRKPSSGLERATARDRLSAFVGREAEHAVLEQALVRALASDGQVIALVGEPGVGKTRLAHEFATRCRDRGIRVLRVAALAHGRDVPLLPVLELWRSALGVRENDDPGDARTRMTAGLVGLDSSFAAELPVLFELLGVEDPEHPAPRIDPEARERRLLALTRRFVRAQGAREPTVLVVEDVQWLDDASALFVAELAQAAAGSRWLLICTLRPERPTDWLAGGHCQLVRLSGLGRGSVAALLKDLLGDHPSLDGVAELVAERAGGNPFFCEELVRALPGEGFLTGTRGDYRLWHSLGSIVLPPTVQAVLAARIDRLAPREKELLWLAAVIGDGLTRRLLGEVSGFAPDVLAPTLGALIAGDLLEAHPTQEALELSFKHPLTREVAYRSQVTERRQRIHAAVAGAIERLHPDGLDERAALIAHHRKAAGQPADAAKWHVRAAAWMARTSSLEAMNHWKAAADQAALLPKGPQRGELRVRAGLGILGEAWRVEIDRNMVDRIYREVVDALGHRPDLAVVRIIADAAYHGSLIFGGREQESFSGDVLARAEELGEPGLIVSLCAGRAFRAVVLTLIPEALATASRGLALAGNDASVGSGFGLESPYAHCLMYRGFSQAWQGQMDAGLSDLTRALESPEIPRGGETESYAATWRSQVLSLLGDGPAALTDAERGMAIAEAAGNVVALTAGSVALNAACRVLGDAESAELHARQGLDLIGSRHVAMLMVPRLQAGLADALLRRGQPAEALKWALCAARTSRERSLGWYELNARLVLGRTLMALARAKSAEAERLDEAASAIDRAAALAASSESRIFEPSIEAERAELATLRGDDKAAVRHQERADAARRLLSAPLHAVRTDG